MKKQKLFNKKYKNIFFIIIGVIGISLFIIILQSCKTKVKTETPSVIENNLEKSTDSLIEGSEMTAKEIKEISEDTLCQFLYYGNCSYWLCEPDDMFGQPDSTWIGSSRVLVMYHPNPGIKTNNQVFLYSYVINKSEFDNITFDEYVKREVEYSVTDNQKVSELKNIRISDSKDAIIRQYFLIDRKEYYAVSYIDENEYIIVIALSAKDLSDYKSYFGKFEQLIKSFKYLGIKVIEVN